MKLYAAILVFALLCKASQSQERDCVRPEISTRQLSVWMSEAQTGSELAQLVCYLHAQSARYSDLAKQQDAALLDAYVYNLGRSKYPSAAEHARRFRELYANKASHYSELANQLEARGQRDRAN